jgi:hypothetical protein
VERDDDLLERRLEPAHVRREAERAAGVVGDAPQRDGIGERREADGVDRPAASGAEAVALPVAARLVAAVGEHDDVLARCGQAVERRAGEGEGGVEVGAAAGVEAREGLLDGGGLRGRRGRQEQAGAAAEGDEGERPHLAAAGGDAGEEAHGLDAQALRVGLAHAVGVVEQDGHVHARRDDRHGLRPDEVAAEAAGTDGAEDEVATAGGHSRPAAEVERGAAVGSGPRDDAAHAAAGVERAAGRREAGFEDGGAAGLGGRQRGEAVVAVVGVLETRRGRRGAQQQRGKPPPPRAAAAQSDLRAHRGLW